MQQKKEAQRLFKADCRLSMTVRRELEDVTTRCAKTGPAPPESDEGRKLLIEARDPHRLSEGSMTALNPKRLSSPGREMSPSPAGSQPDELFCRGGRT